jgi:hypothetical protein
MIVKGRQEIKQAQEKLNSSLTTPIAESEMRFFTFSLFHFLMFFGQKIVVGWDKNYYNYQSAKKFFVLIRIEE